MLRPQEKTFQVYRKLLSRYEDFARKEISPSWKVGLALSGGVDSMLLARLMADARTDGVHRTVVFLHIDHGIRDPRDSEKDIECVLALSVRLSVPLIVHRVAHGHIQTHSREAGGIEAAARLLRYRILEDLGAEYDVIFTAHHADDQFETALLGLLHGEVGRFRNGLQAKKGKYYRPYLLMIPSVKRLEIEAAAKEVDLSYMEDKSNFDTRYERNFLRGEIIPRLELQFGNLPAKLARLRAGLEETSVDMKLAEKLWNELPGFEGSIYRASRTELLRAGESQFAFNFYFLCERLMPGHRNFRITRKFIRQFCDYIIASEDSRKAMAFQGNGLYAVVEGAEIYASTSLAHSTKKEYFLELVPGDYCDIAIFGGRYLRIMLESRVSGMPRMYIQSGLRGDGNLKSPKSCHKLEYLMSTKGVGQGLPTWLLPYLPRISDGRTIWGLILPNFRSNAWYAIDLRTAGAVPLRIEKL